MTAVPTILVVEDNPTTRKMLRLTLATEGFTVIEASDARSALAAVDRVLPDLVLQDLILPDMDGLELLRRLRALPGGTELPILALSGFLSRLEEAQPGRGGFTALLVKPIEPSRLVDAIRLYLPEQSVRASWNGQGQRLLVVDDDPVQLKLTRIHFSQLGFEVSAAGGALDALIAARANRPDVVLSDIFMPGTDGFELCLEIRRDPSLATVPVVLLSAQYGSKADEEMARSVGANALVLRTPDFGNVASALVEALGTSSPAVAEQPSDQLALRHARLVIHQLERQAAAMAGLVQRCGIQAAEISLLSGVANALTHKSDPDVALREVLAATLDAAGISKGALILRDDSGVLALRQDIGFSEAERSKLLNFFGHGALLEDIVTRGGSVPVPSPAIPVDASRDILAGANVAAAQVVPLIYDGRGVGAMIIGANHRDVTSDDSVAFARAMGNQVVQSLELARSVARLTASEQRYRTLLENANDFVAVLTPDGIVREVNRRWVDLTGLPLEQLIGRHVHEFAPPGKEGESGDADDDCVEIARQNGSSAFIEFSRTDLDVGGERLIFTIGRDVTERLRAVEALRTSEERMRFALQNADVGIWDMDYLTGMLRWSETIEAHYGFQPGTFGGTFEAFFERVHPDDRAALLESVEAAMKSGADFSVQNRSIWPDGTVRWLNGTGRVLLGEHGEPVRGVGISLDVTERRTLEAQYQQAQKMEAVGRLAGGVAHDFNNLLTVILGYCELLMADFKPGDPHHADITEIHKAGARAGGLTRQLLAFSRKQIIEPTLLDFNLIAADIRAMLGRLIGEDIKVVLDLQPGLALVKADRGQVEQIVMNFAVNARDAMPNGGRLTIETANVALDEQYSKTHLDVKPGPYVALTITDSGTGMTPEVQARLFEPFFTTKDPGKGTGLGLATVYGIVSQAGGSVAVQSEVGRGTSFKVYFPRADAAELVDTPAPIARSRTGTQTVLVVEDEVGVRQLAKRLLARQGYTVLVAADANEAVRLFEANPSIDVLLTDVVMPGPSGPELTRQLVEQRPELRVIYMSGYTEESIAHHGVLKPGIAFLHKPFTSETLGQKIREVLDR